MYFKKGACYILSPLTPYFPLNVLFGLWFNVSNAPSLLLSMLSSDETPTHLPLLLPPHLWSPICTFSRPGRPRYSSSSPFSFSHVLPPPCFNSIMDVHEAQFTSRAFSIISGVNSLAVPASPLHVFVEAAPGSLSAFTLLTRSLHQPDAQQS